MSNGVASAAMGGGAPRGRRHCSSSTWQRGGAAVAVAVGEAPTPAVGPFDHYAHTPVQLRL